MSTSSSELSWLSSDEIEALELAPEPQQRSPIWQNKWTPINLPNRLVATTLPSPLPSQGINEQDDESSINASHHRDAILASAERMKQVPKGKKRKSSSASPPPARKKLSVTTSPKEAGGAQVIPSEMRTPSKKVARGPRKPKTAQPEINDSLLPIRPSKLNIRARAEKRTASEAFSYEVATRPAKKMLTVRGAKKKAGDGDIDSGLKEQGKLSMDLNQVDKKQSSDIENAEQADKEEDSEDLFDNDDTYIEEFLEVEKALIAETTSPSKPPIKPDLDKKPLSKTSLLLTSNTAQPFTSPMKPFIRPFLPLPSSSDTSPTGSIVSPLHRSPTCFRIAEALRYISSTLFSTDAATGKNKSLTLETYAILHASMDHGVTHTLRLADIFFPGRPPYLNAIIANATLGTKSPSRLGELKNKLIRTVVQIVPNSAQVAPSSMPESSPSTTSTSLAGKCTVTVLRLDKTDWAEIQRLKDILDGSADGTVNTPSKSTSASASIASKAAKTKVTLTGKKEV